MTNDKDILDEVLSVRADVDHIVTAISERLNLGRCGSCGTFIRRDGASEHGFMYRSPEGTGETFKAVEKYACLNCLARPSGWPWFAKQADDFVDQLARWLVRQRLHTRETMKATWQGLLAVHPPLEGAVYQMAKHLGV